MSILIDWFFSTESVEKIKRTLKDYCEAKHPNDHDAQDALFEAICNGTVTPDTDEVIRTINEYQDGRHTKGEGR